MWSPSLFRMSLHMCIQTVDNTSIIQLWAFARATKIKWILHCSWNSFTMKTKLLLTWIADAMLTKCWMNITKATINQFDDVTLKICLIIWESCDEITQNEILDWEEGGGCYVMCTLNFHISVGIADTSSLHKFRIAHSSCYLSSKLNWFPNSSKSVDRR